MENTEEFATQEEMIEEATKRLKILAEMPDFEKSVLSDWERDQTLFYSERASFEPNCKPFGILYWITNEEKFVKLVDDLQREKGGLVYHATLERTEFGTCLDFFYISKYKEEWQMDREDLRHGRTLAYVNNLDDPFCSEFGMIGFCCSGGGLIRTA